MLSENTLVNEVASEGYDAADKPFDFIEEGKDTVLLCVSGDDRRAAVKGQLKGLNCRVQEALSARDALMSMRFHVYQQIVIDEGFETGGQEENPVLKYLEGLAMGTRRRIFVVLLSERVRTMDNMAAFQKSVNIVVNVKNINELGTIMKKALFDNDAFYHVFRESLRNTGR